MSLSIITLLTGLLGDAIEPKNMIWTQTTAGCLWMRQLLCSWCTKVLPGLLYTFRVWKLHFLSTKVHTRSILHKWQIFSQESTWPSWWQWRRCLWSWRSWFSTSSTEARSWRKFPPGSASEFKREFFNTQLMVIIDDPYFWFEILLRIICIFVHVSRGSCLLHQVCSWLLWKKMYDQIWLEPIYVKQF